MKEQEKSTENLSIDTAVLSENIKEPSIWVNFFLKVIYLVFLNFIVPFLGFITLLQLLFSIGSKKPNENLVSFSKKISSYICLLYTSPSPRDSRRSRMPSSA